MNNFLIIVIILLFGGGLYEYTTLQQQLQRAQSEELRGLNGQGGRLDNLQGQIRIVDGENARLKKDLQDANLKITDLTEELKDAKKAVEDMRLSALATEKAADAAIEDAKNPSKPKPAAPPAPPPVIKLGTIVTLDGRAYQQCQLLKVEPDGITFSHAEGITKVMFRFLPLELQKRFGHHDEMPDPDDAPAPVNDAANPAPAPAPAN